MLQSILGIKKGQTQEFTDDGRRIPVTKILAGPCYITANISNNAYQAVQVGFLEKRSIGKPLEGHIKKAGFDGKKLRFFREIRVGELTKELQVGNQITVGEVFKPGDFVRVIGTSKGKGFMGVVRRHHFKGGPRTHGQSDRERSPGSIGQTTTPGRVYRGKRMAGHKGVDRVGVSGLQIISIHPDTQMVTIKGLVPGSINGLVIIQKES
jgi:large subunit ribosomal protein L3